MMRWGGWYVIEYESPTNLEWDNVKLGSQVKINFFPAFTIASSIPVGLFYTKLIYIYIYKGVDFFISWQVSTYILSGIATNGGIKF